VTDRVPLTVVIVSYESAAELGTCLQSVLAACRSSDQVLLVDNASTDGSASIARRFAPRVEVLENAKNVGFATAVNQGVRLAGHPLCLVLNPDTILSSGALERLVECLETLGPDAVVGPRLSGRDGSLQRSAFRFPTPKVLLIEQLNAARWWPGFVPDDASTAEIEVEWLKGACLLGRTAELLRLGPFDERFFMFGEDVDLGLRLRQAGGRCVYCPSANVIHLGGRSTRQHERRMTLEFVLSTYRLYRLHGWNDQLPLASAVIRSTALLKASRAIWGAGVALVLGRRSSATRAIRSIGTFARMAKIPTDEPMPELAPGPVPAEPASRTPAVVEDQPEHGAAVPIEPPAIEPPAIEPPLPEPARPGDGQTAARGSLALLLSFGVIAIVNYAFAVVMSWLLPIEGYGVLGISQAILLVTSTVVSAGFPWALAQIVARTGDAHARASAFRTALSANLRLGGAIALIVAGIALSGLIRPVDAYGPALVIVALTTAVLAVNAILASTLQGLLRLDGLAFVRASEVVLKAIAGVALVAIGFGTTGAIAGFLVGAVLATALAAWLLRDFATDAGRGHVDRNLLRAAGPFFVAMVGFAMVSQLDIVTVKAFSAELDADHLAGQYQVAATLSRVPFFAAMALFGAIFPFVARTLGQGDVARAYARLSLKYTLLFIVPIGVVLITIPDAAIRLFFSDKYDLSAAALRYTAGASIILALAYGVAILLQAQGQPRRPAVALAAAVPGQLLLAGVLVPALGLIGAALSMGAAAALVLALLAPSVIRSFDLRTEPRDVLRYAIALAAMSGLLLILPHTDRLTTAVDVVVASLAYVVGLAVLRLVTGRDVETLGSALGSRGLGPRRRVARLVDSLQRSPGRP
jgi:N-acetylglucosaminyl-diphospho-decaprenol L-rhamnosyltransferase